MENFNQRVAALEITNPIVAERSSGSDDITLEVAPFIPLLQHEDNRIA